MSMMKIIRIVLILLLFLILSSTFFTPPVFAQTADELTKQIEEKRTEIEKLETHLEDTRRTEKTLKSQLDYIDSQVKVTQLKIEEILPHIKNSTKLFKKYFFF